MLHMCTSVFVPDVLLIRCALSWAVEADLRGVQSRECRLLAAQHDLCLKNRKHCYQLLLVEEEEGGGSLARHPIFPYPSSVPHYMSDGSTHPSKDSDNIYHSTSVLGRLFDHAQGAIMAAEEKLHGALPPPSSAPIVLDSDFNIDNVDMLLSAGGDDVKKFLFLQAATDLLTR